MTCEPCMRARAAAQTVVRATFRGDANRAVQAASELKQALTDKAESLRVRGLLRR